MVSTTTQAPATTDEHLARVGLRAPTRRIWNDDTRQTLSVRVAISSTVPATDGIDAAAGAHDGASLEELHDDPRQYPYRER